MNVNCFHHALRFALLGGDVEGWCAPDCPDVGGYCAVSLVMACGALAIRRRKRVCRCLPLVLGPAAPEFAPSSSVTLVHACAPAAAREVDDGAGSVKETVSSASGITSTVVRRPGRDLLPARPNDPNDPNSDTEEEDSPAELTSCGSSSCVFCVDCDEEYDGPGSILVAALGVGVGVVSTGRVLLRCL